MTATLESSTAILKTAYESGVPKLTYTSFKMAASLVKRTDHKDDFLSVPLQTELPQGSSVDMPTALAGAAQGNYVRFKVGRVEHFGVARIKGQALRVAEKSQGSLIDLWTNEIDGILMTEMENIEVYAFGNGSGVRGAITGSTASTSITLSRAEDVTKFALNMRVQAVSNSTLSPTLRNGTATITGINRSQDTATLTAASAWNGVILGFQSGDYLVRAGDYAAAGTKKVIAGLQQLFEGGDAPSTLHELVRTTDPVRLAGQTKSFSNVQLEDAITDALADVASSGGRQPDVFWCHPKVLSRWKKQVSSKVVYERVQRPSAVPGVSFSGIRIEADDGSVDIMTSPYCDIDQGFLFQSSSVKLATAGEAPMILDFDSLNFLRVASDDAYEVRTGLYGDTYTNNPLSGYRLTGLRPA